MKHCENCQAMLSASASECQRCGALVDEEGRVVALPAGVSANPPRASATPSIRSAAIGVAVVVLVVAGGLALAGKLWLVVVIAVALLISLPFIFAVRLFRWYRKASETSKTAQAAESERLAEYERSTSPVTDSSPAKAVFFDPYDGPPVAAGAPAEGFSDAQVALNAVRCVALIIIVGGFACLWATSPLLDGTFRFGARVLPLLSVLYAALLTAAYFALRRHSLAPRGCGELVLAMPLLVPALVGALALANEWFDRTEAKTYNVPLLSYHAIRGRHGHPHSWRLEFPSWREQESEHFVVSLETGAQASPGQIWQIRVRRGWLAQPWVESMRPIGRI